VVHITDAITDTRAQKVIRYTSAHIAESVFPHDQHREEPEPYQPHSIHTN